MEWGARVAIACGKRQEVCGGAGNLIAIQIDCDGTLGGFESETHLDGVGVEL